MSIAGVPSGWTLPGYLITAHHSYALSTACVGERCGGFHIGTNKQTSSLVQTQSQALYRSATSSAHARHPSSCFDVGNEEANLRVIFDVADGHANL